MNKYGIAVVLILICSSCEKGLFHAGKTISEEFLITESLNLIEVQNIFDITLVQDTINKTVVTCGENLMDDIHVSVIENVLYLNHSVSYNWSRTYEKIKISIHLKTFPQIYLKAPAKLTTKDTIKTDNFIVVAWERFAEVDACIDANFCGIYMSLDDFGKYVVKGKCNTAEIYPCGSGYVDCRNLVTINCKVWQRSMADTYINTTKALQVEFKGKGNIYYTGNPDTIEYLNQPVSGKLIEMTSK